MKTTYTCPAFAFDLGKVLFDFDYGRALTTIREHVKSPVNEIVNEIFYNKFTYDFEKGIESGDFFYKKFAQRFGCSLAFSDFIDLWNSIFYPMPETISLVKRLKTMYPLYLISNINEWHYRYLSQAYPEVFECFQKLILSYQVKHIKPEIEIYRILHATAMLDWHNIIYIDDRQDLIEAAAPLGLQCIHYTSYQKLVERLHELAIDTEKCIG